MISEDTVQNCCTDFWLGTPGFPTLVALHAQSLTIQAVRGDLFVPRTRTTRLGRCSVFITAPVVLDLLPLHLRSPSTSCSQFLSGLKTHLFRLAFHWLFLSQKRLNWS